MEVLHSNCHRHAPVAQGVLIQFQNTKTLKVVRTNSRNSPISGISDNGSSRSIKSDLSNNKNDRVKNKGLTIAFLVLSSLDQLRPQDHQQ
jgi:hypothetical protein